MDRLSLPRELQDLLRPEMYPHRVEDVEVLQTHISYLFFAGSYVYKWKKPLHLGFLDFSTLESRRHFCLEEVRLNRRLCPNVYLGVVGLTREKDGYRLDGRGEVVEYGVQMRRLPARQMMGLVMDRGELSRNHLDTIIDRLVPFYREASVQYDPAGYGGHMAIQRTVMENFSETAPFVDSPALPHRRYMRLKDYQEGVLADSALFDGRVAAGRVRDCHGDLHSGNICLTREVAIFDCIEFSERLRITDVAADVAFLAMDLDYHGLGEMGNYFISRFIKKTRDEGLRAVLNFYKSYRAYVRGKIGLLAGADAHLDPGAAVLARKMAANYFKLAEEYVHS